MKKYLVPVFILLFVFLTDASAQPGFDAISVKTDPDGSQTYSLSIQVLLFMTALSFLPAALIMMTSFMRIIIVLSILRQALGTAQTPTNQILIGLALFLTFFIMSPVFNKVYQEAAQPYLEKDLRLCHACDWHRH